MCVPSEDDERVTNMLVLRCTAGGRLRPDGFSANRPYTNRGCVRHAHSLVWGSWLLPK